MTIVVRSLTLTLVFAPFSSVTTKVLSLTLTLLVTPLTSRPSTTTYSALISLAEAIVPTTSTCAPGVMSAGFNSAPNMLLIFVVAVNLTVTSRAGANTRGSC